MTDPVLDTIRTMRRAQTFEVVNALRGRVLRESVLQRMAELDGQGVIRAQVTYPEGKRPVVEWVEA